MRILTTAAREAKDYPSSTPVNILKLELPAPVGTVHYSDRDITVGAIVATGIVTSWGALEYRRQADGHSSNSCTIGLSDPDKSLLAALTSAEWQRATATLYQHFEGNAQADLVTLLKGIAVGPLAWDENSRTLQLDIIDIATKWDKPIGTIATRQLFPDIDADDEGRLIPIVYGKLVKRVKAIPTTVGRRGSLLRDIGLNDTTIHLEGFEDLAPGTSVTLRIGQEIVTGNIHGYELQNVLRGEELVSGRTQVTQTDQQAVATDLPGADSEYAGFWLKVHCPNNFAGGPTGTGAGGSIAIAQSGSSWQLKRITGFDAATGLLTWEGGNFIRLQNLGPGTYPPETTYVGGIPFAWGSPWLLPAGTALHVVSLPSAHAAGEEAFEMIAGGVKYTVADHPCYRILAVWTRGIVRERVGVAQDGQPPELAALGDMFAQGAEEANMPQQTRPPRESWIRVSSLHYKGNLNDSTTYPAVGHALTTLALPGVPMLGLNATTSDVWVDLEGVPNGGAPIQNPVEVIHDIMTRFGGLGGAEIDASISGTSVSSRIPFMRDSFAIIEQRRLVELLSDLAFQCRCRFYTTDDAKGALEFLHHFLPPHVSEIGGEEIALDSIRFGWRELERCATRIRFTFTPAGSDAQRQQTIEDAAAIAALGVREYQMDLYAHDREETARFVAQFWLDRMKRLNKRVVVRTAMPALDIQPNDQVLLYRSGLLDTSPALVEAVVQAPGAGAQERMDMIDLECALPIWAGCASSCEAECQTGCEANCEFWACQVGCETSCQTPCQATCQAVCTLGCESILELACLDGCQTSCTFGCELQCTGSNMIFPVACGIVGACETSCTSCIEAGYACQTGCQPASEGAGACCPAGCDVGACQSACQALVCQAKCEAFACQIACTACQTVCQGPPGEAGCEGPCQSQCQLGCETWCEFCCEFGIEL